MDDPPIMVCLPRKVFSAFVDHTGEGYYGPKSEAILADLARHWMATTKAAPLPWRDEDDDDEDEDDDGDGDGDGEDAAGAETAAARPVAVPAVDPRAAEQGDVPAGAGACHGYQWKQVFLPNGTELRTIYCGHSLYATVENEQIISDGVATTPSRLANAQGCGTRNAWKTIWLRFPGTTRWELAARCRAAGR